MSISSPLTTGQLALLQRIAEGSRPLTSADSRLAISVYALRSRRLVATKSQRSYWTATVTDRGRALLEHGRLPDAAAARPSAGRDTRRAALEGPAVSAADLVRQVQDAGGELRLKDPAPAERAAWRRAIHAARVAGVPNGLRLSHRGRHDGDLVISLVSADEEVERPRPPEVRVPTKLDRLHPILAATRDVSRADPSGWVDTMRRPGVLHMKVTKQNVTRVLRIAHGLFREADRRGHAVGTSVADRQCAGGAAVTIGGQRFELTFMEQTSRIPHVLTREEQAREHSWYTPKWDFVATGRVVLRRGHTSDRKLAADGERWRLEDRLGRVLADLEDLASELDASAAQREADELQRLRTEKANWEEAMRVARSRLSQSGRTDHLDDQVERWDRAGKIRAFVDAVRATAPSPDSVEPKTAIWLAWASDYADSIDPLLGPLHMPDSPEPTNAALERFLVGWSAYGPTRRVHR